MNFLKQLIYFSYFGIISSLQFYSLFFGSCHFFHGFLSKGLMHNAASAGERKEDKEVIGIGRQLE
jgi:hypothetical protein